MNLTIIYTVYDNEPVIHFSHLDVDDVDALYSSYKIKYPCCECVVVDLVYFLQSAIINYPITCIKFSDILLNNNP